MTTASWSTVLDQSTDAGFRAWGSELGIKMAACGMVQTADTGQINWTTVTRAAVINTAAGYEIWRVSSSNIFFKIEYGTGTTQPNFPAIWITAGTGSNGTGTLTGQLSTRTAPGFTNAAPNSLVTSYQSFMCATANFFGLSWKIASNGTTGAPRCMWAVGQTVDNTGTATSTGYGVVTQAISGGAPVKLQTVRTAATAATRNQTSSFCVFVGLPTISSDGTNNQAYIHWFDAPGVLPSLYTGTIISSELSLGSTMSWTPVGTTPHTYVCISAATSLTWDAAGTTSPVMGGIMLFE